jgi:hypothetical protein
MGASLPQFPIFRNGLLSDMDCYPSGFTSYIGHLSHVRLPKMLPHTLEEKQAIVDYMNW